MGKPHKIVVSIVAAVLYCVAASGFSDGVSHSSRVDQHVEKTGSVILVAEELPIAGSFAIKDGAGFWSGGSITPGSLKKSLVYKAVNDILEVQVANAVFQYESHLLTNPVRIRKSDMLFPFHYFFETDRA